MNKNGFSVAEILITTGIFTVILTAVMLAGRVGSNAAFFSSNLDHITSSARYTVEKLSNDISSSNYNIISVRDCAVGETDCKSGTKKLLLKVPIADGQDVAGTVYTSSGSIKYGADRKQNCLYEYKVTPQNQLIRNTKCDNNKQYCGDRVCTASENNKLDLTQFCVYDCGSCGDGICSAAIGENVTSCPSDCVRCGDGICSQSEDCTSCSQDCGICSPTCFLAGTPITMADGFKKPIEEIKVGDKVLSFDEKTNQFKPDKVTKLLKHTSYEYLIVNGHLKVTPNHRVLSNGKWVEIGSLKVGNQLFNENGQAEIIHSIEKVKERVTTYNIEINPYHTYVAGGYVVHNLKM